MGCDLYCSELTQNNIVSGITLTLSVFKNQQRFKGHAPRCDLWYLQHEEVHMVASSAWLFLWPGNPAFSMSTQIFTAMIRNDAKVKKERQIIIRKHD